MVIVDEHDYHTFKPLLYQVATGLLEQPAVGHPIRDLVHKQENARVHIDAVESIDLEKREVRFAELKPLAYDYLVLALGAEVNFFGVEGAVEHAFPLYTLPDAVRLKEHVLERWEAADRDPSLIEDGALNVVVVGGGPTGVETAGALAELYNGVFVNDYRDVPAGSARITLVEAGPDLFTMFKENLREYTRKALTKLQVEIMTGEVVQSVGERRVTLKSGTVIPAHTLVWGAGLQGNALVNGLGLELAARQPHRRRRAAPHPGAPRGLRRRRPRGDHRPEDGAGAAAARLRRAPVRRARRQDDRAPRRRQGARAVQVHRQGHDGGDRPGRGGRPDAGRQDDAGQEGAARLGHGAPRAAADELGPREGGRRLERRCAHAPALGPDQRQHGEGSAMSDPTAMFFDELAGRGHDQRVERATGTIRIEAGKGARARGWNVELSKGDIAVSQKRAAADCTVRADEATTAGILTGRINPTAALLRGAVELEGNPRHADPAPPAAARPTGQAEQEEVMSDGLVKILDGNTFVVSDGAGDMEASLTDPTGLFSYDTRFLSKWVLTIDGQRLNALSVDDLQYFETRFFLVPGTGTVYIDAKLSVIRQRSVANGFEERVTVLNHDDKPVNLRIRIDAASDFADLFEVKDALAEEGRLLAGRRGATSSSSPTRARRSGGRRRSPRRRRRSTTRRA